MMVSRLFVAELVPAAIARLREYAKKGADPNGRQLDAVKTILDRAGLIAPKASEPVNHDREIEDMTTEQLHAFITEAEGVISSRIAPSETIPNSQAFDMLE